MHRIATLLLMFALCLGVVHAQSSDTLEIRGTVFELGSDGAPSLPVAGVEVTLNEFVLVDNLMTRSVSATAYTDPQGAYQFHPQHLGDYYVEVKKDGYSGVAPGTAEFTGASAKLDQAHPALQLSFTLTRRGALTGRVIDEDGQPVPDLKVTVQPLGQTPFLATAVTAADGTFTASNLLPGPRVVRISSSAGELEKIEPHFSAGDLKTVDQDFETTYWPGGSAEPAASIPVSPGATAGVGTIRVRKTPYYRVHVSVPRVECAPGERWTFSTVDSKGEALGILPRGPRAIPCTSDFLVSNLRPGSYSFMLRKDEPAPGQWALASVNISNKNIEVALTLEPDAQITGRFIPAEGAALPPLNKISVSAAGGTPPVFADAEGKFILRNLKFPGHRIFVMGLTSQYYVKEIRFNGMPSFDGFVTLSSGAANQAEIVIDDKPGVVAGTVTDGDEPADGAMVSLFAQDPSQAKFGARTDSQGRFRFAGLVPGEYRAVAVPFAATRPENEEAVSQLAARAESIKVERGGATNVDLKLTDPSH
jgi:hypothetical protein